MGENIMAKKCDNCHEKTASLVFVNKPNQRYVVYTKYLCGDCYIMYKWGWGEYEKFNEQKGE